MTYIPLRGVDIGIATTFCKEIHYTLRKKKYFAVCCQGCSEPHHREYRQNKDLVCDELTPDMIEEYKVWLANRNQKPNTIRFYLRTLNTLFCKAANNGMLSEERKLFSHVRLSYVTTTKRALSEADILALQNLKLEAGTTLAFATDGTEYKQYKRVQKKVNRTLKKLGIMIGLKTPLTSYVARHSWASIARDMNKSNRNTPQRGLTNMHIF